MFTVSGTVPSWPSDHCTLFGLSCLYHVRQQISITAYPSRFIKNGIEGPLTSLIVYLPDRARLVPTFAAIPTRLIDNGNVKYACLAGAKDVDQVNNAIASGESRQRFELAQPMRRYSITGEIAANSSSVIYFK